MRLPFELDRPLVFFDLETTGLDLKNDRIIELAFIKITKDGLVLMETAPGVTANEVIEKTGAPLVVSPDLREMDI